MNRERILHSNLNLVLPFFLLTLAVFFAIFRQVSLLIVNGSARTQRHVHGAPSTNITVI